MISLNNFCQLCGSYLIQLTHLPDWKGCSCGTRRMDKEIITLSDLITSSDKYPERAQSPELTQQLKDNGVKLLNKVNQFLKELGIKEAQVSSGFRPSAVNAALANSAKKSLHMQCLAVDIADPDGSLDKLVESKPELLKKYGLWLEDPGSTPGWCHLDSSETRTDRPVRVFKP